MRENEINEYDFFFLRSMVLSLLFCVNRKIRCDNDNVRNTIDDVDNIESNERASIIKVHKRHQEKCALMPHTSVSERCFFVTSWEKCGKRSSLRAHWTVVVHPSSRYIHHEL